MLKISDIIKKLQKVRSQLIYVIGNNNQKAFNAYKLLVPILKASFLFTYKGKNTLTQNATYKLKRLCFYDKYESKIKQFHMFMFYIGVIKDSPLKKVKPHFYKFIGVEDGYPVIRLAKMTDITTAIDNYISLFRDLKQAIHFEHANANPQGKIFFSLESKLNISNTDLLKLEDNWPTKVLFLRSSLEKCIIILLKQWHSKKIKLNHKKFNYLQTYVQKLRNLKGQGVLGSICYVNPKDYEPMSPVPMADMKSIKSALCESACQFSKAAKVYVLTHCGLNLRAIANKYHIEPSQLQELRDDILTYEDLTYNEIFRLCDIFDNLKSKVSFQHVSIMLSRY